MTGSANNSGGHTILSYYEQLQHPRWQRRRLEMLARAGFTCSLCGDQETQLHVHHPRYVPGRLAWEYSDDELTVLCKNCHSAEHDAVELEKPNRQSSLIARACSLLLAYPQVAGLVDDSEELAELDCPGATCLRRLLTICQTSPGISTAGIIDTIDQRFAAGLLGLIEEEPLDAWPQAGDVFKDVIARLIVASARKAQVEAMKARIRARREQSPVAHLAQTLPAEGPRK